VLAFWGQNELKITYKRLYLKKNFRGQSRGQPHRRRGWEGRQGEEKGKEGERRGKERKGKGMIGREWIMDRGEAAS
jgi:hypothetical protein